MTSLIHICESNFMASNPAVKTALRTLDVFEAFSTLRRPLSLTELARQIGAPISSCFELLHTLEARGYLYPVGEGRIFYPTGSLIEHARVIAANDPVLQRLAHSIKSLRDLTRETVILGRLQNEQALYLEVVEGPETIRYTARAGDSKPLHSSSIGKALLGRMEPGERLRLLEALPLPRITANTIVSREALLADLEAAGGRGVYVTRGENVADVMAMAITVELDAGLYGIAVAGPLQRMESHHDRHAEELLALQAALEPQP